MRRDMKRLGLFLCGTALALGTAALLRGQGAHPPSWPELERLPPELRELAVTWLPHACGAGGDQGLAEQVVAAGTRLEAAFWEAWRLGPPSWQVARERQAFSQAYRKDQVWLRERCEPLFGAEPCRRELQVSEHDSIKRQLADSAQVWREGALRGLGLVGGDETLAELARIAADVSRPGAAAAAEALRRRRNAGRRADAPG